MELGGFQAATRIRGCARGGLVCYYGLVGRVQTPGLAVASRLVAVVVALNGVPGTGIGCALRVW